MFDPTKPCQTRDGREVQVLRQGVIDTRLTAFIKDEHNPDKWVLRTYHPDGRFYWNLNAKPIFCGDDLVNVPTKVKREGWVNIYSYADSEKSAHQSGVWRRKKDALKSVERASKCGVTRPVATVKIEWEEEQ